MYRSWQWRWRHRAETKQCHPEHPFPESQFVHLNPRSQHVALQRHIETSFYTISKYFRQKNDQRHQKILQKMGRSELFGIA